MSKTNFEGDVLIKSANDGSDIAFEDGLICDTGGFATSVYLSLFGGNEKDDAGRDKETWWGNLIPGTKQDEKIISNFQAVTKSMPLTSGNLKKAKDAAKRDLDWVIEEGLADEIDADIYAENSKRIQLNILCKRNGDVVLDAKYYSTWEGIKNGL